MLVELIVARLIGEKRVRIAALASL